MEKEKGKMSAALLLPLQKLMNFPNLKFPNASLRIRVLYYGRPGKLPGAILARRGEDRQVFPFYFFLSPLHIAKKDFKLGSAIYLESRA